VRLSGSEIGEFTLLAAGRTAGKPLRARRGSSSTTGGRTELAIRPLIVGELVRSFMEVQTS